MSEIIHGRNLIIKLDGKAIAAAKSCDIQIQTDMIEVSSPTAGRYRKYIAGRTDWSVNTSHLVVSPLADLQMTGKEYDLTFMVRNAEPLPFDGFVSGVIILLQPTIEYTAILYDQAVNRFVALVDNGLQQRYYQSWLGGDDYIQPTHGNVYEYNDIYYRWENGELVEVSSSEVGLTGTAICQTAKIVGTVGSLANGSFAFQGVGPLE